MYKHQSRGSQIKGYKIHQNVPKMWGEWNKEWVQI